MKICLISNLYHPHNRGGAEQVVKNTAEALKSRGEEVILITAQPYNGLSSLKAKVSVENGIKIYRFYPLNLFFYANLQKHNALVRLLWHFFDIYNWHSYFVIKKILKKERPNIVHTHNLKGIGYLIPRAIKSFMFKQVHTLHDIQLHCPSGLMIKGQEKNWQQKGFLTKKYSKICKKKFASVSVIISPSKWLMNYYYADKGFFKKTRKVVLRNPVITKTRKHENPSTRLRAGTKTTIANGNSVSYRKLSFLFIGQIEKHKGILFLIKVFNALADLNIQLDIIGDGSQLNKAKEMVKNNPNIIFYGRLSHKQTLQHLDLADFVIVPSLCYENLPNVVSEALSAGKPVIAADIGGTAELIIDGFNGYKFLAGDEGDLINKINLAIKNVDKFDPDKVVESVGDWGVDNYIERLMRLYKDDVSSEGGVFKD